MTRNQATHVRTTGGDRGLPATSGFAEALREICAGIEEEGMQSRTIALQTTNATALAYEAAARSPLLVGVGVAQEQALHPRRRPPGRHPAGAPQR